MYTIKDNHKVKAAKLILDNLDIDSTDPQYQALLDEATHRLRLGESIDNVTDIIDEVWDLNRWA